LALLCVICIKIKTVLQSYDETLTFLYERLPMFSRIGAAAYKKDLYNTTALCSAFGNPERKLKAIHIAGTNGKGSTSHMLAAIFHRAGYKTGLYTSPHLKDFRERIKVSGEKVGDALQPLQMIPKDFIIEFTAQAEPFIEVLQPSFFELTVVMAFQYFVEQQVDIAIIETGLGGRLDSTNVIMPELSVITNISLDHTHLLGNTLEEIATEKAGIIKPSIPVVIGEKVAVTETVFSSKADTVNAPVNWAEERFFLKSYEAGTECLKMEWRGLGETETFLLETDLPGTYQLKNVGTVLTAVSILNQRGYTLPDNVVADALKDVKAITGLHGRY
jgi:dihydrofolate synthase / folylpolyglutamate synthase